MLAPNLHMGRERDRGTYTSMIQWCTTKHVIAHSSAVYSLYCDKTMCWYNYNIVWTPLLPNIKTSKHPPWNITLAHTSQYFLQRSCQALSASELVQRREDAVQPHPEELCCWWTLECQRGLPLCQQPGRREEGRMGGVGHGEKKKEGKTGIEEESVGQMKREREAKGKDRRDMSEVCVHQKLLCTD